jgi:hypothetical protein
MLLTPLYRARFTYPEAWHADLSGGLGRQSVHFFFAEGICDGRLAGRLRGANHPVRRTDGTFMPDFQGVIETDDGAVVLFDWHGYGRAYPEGARQVVVSATHVSDDDRYQWLNDVVCVGTGEVRPTELVIEMAELVWEPPAE